MDSFVCNECEYSSKKYGNYIRHLKSIKHKKNINIYDKINDNEKEYYCCCGKIFKHYSSLSRHKVKCLLNLKINQKDLYKLKEEVENLKIKLSETQQQIISTTNNNHSNNTYNTTNNNINFNFNYTIKLNEKFPDALTMNDFISLLEDSCGDLTKIATKPSFISQVSRMICDKMSELDTENRPLHFINHCGEDAFYMKDGEGWDKASHEKIGNKIESTARGISKVHFGQWNQKLDTMDEYPDEWTKQINHVTKEVTPEDLNKGITKLKKVTSLNKKLLT